MPPRHQGGARGARSGRHGGAKGASGWAVMSVHSLIGYSSLTILLKSSVFLLKVLYVLIFYLTTPRFRCFLYQGSTDMLFHTVEPQHPILQIDCYFSLGPSLATFSTLSQVKHGFRTELTFMERINYTNILVDILVGICYFKIF